MVGTGMPKFVSMKTIGYIIGGIVIVVAVLVAWYYIRAVFAEFIEYPKTGEKYRFMRYMTCAMAMCAAPNIKGGSNDGCTSDKVMVTILEYDEGGNPVKGCKQFCEEIRGEMIEEHYCGKEYKLEFEFKDGVTYHADYVVEQTFLFDWWKTCGGAQPGGVETDIIRRMPWHTFLDGGKCFEEELTCDYTHGLYGNFPCGLCEGILEKSDNKCERIQTETSPYWKCVSNTGHIWIGPDIGNQCEELPPEIDKGYFGNPLYANCTFEVGQKIQIWTEEDVYEGVYCPEIILCKVEESG